MEEIRFMSMRDVWTIALLCGFAGTALGLIVLAAYSFLMGVI